MKPDGQNNLRIHPLIILLSLLSLFEALPSRAMTPQDEARIIALKTEGTLLRLKADYEGVHRISDQLKALFPEHSIGYTINLNTLVTRLSWDSQQQHYDQIILDDAEKTLSLCRAQIKAKPKDYDGYYYCGQAHFALTYLHALRGNYYRAGKNGSDTIETLEQTLALNPDLIDAKMHLGVAYYYADNLPPFIKAFSRFLWFVPTGNSERSLPYIKEVSERGQYFKDVAKFLYSDLLINGNDNDREQAINILNELITLYPENRRFQLRYISLLGEVSRFEQSLATANEFIATEKTYARDAIDIALVRLWATRAYLGLHDIDGAISAFGVIEQTAANREFPSWGKSWFTLTLAQIQDLRDQRKDAIANYKKVIKMFADYAGTEVIDAAKHGLDTPFTVSSIN
jgi:tetratricopeptide (TPR) repeat protein